MFKHTIIFAVIAGLVFALAPAAQAVSIAMVPVGDAGNTADTRYGTDAPRPLGSVDYVYYIGTYEVTNAQYCEFLNAVAATDTHALYNAGMGTGTVGGITQSGVSGSFTYATKTYMADKPVNYVSIFDAMRFANWLHNGQGAADTENGAYTLTAPVIGNNSVTRNADWKWAVAGLDEWYKAAFYKGGGLDAGYWTYATQSDTLPTAVQAVDVGETGNVGDGRIGAEGGTTPVKTGNYVNYNSVADWNGVTPNVTTVGTNGGPSAHGTFDQSGNMGENLDTVKVGSAPTANDRYNYEGAYNLNSNYLARASRLDRGSREQDRFGFRVVAVPEPATMALLGLGGLGVVLRRRRR